GADARTGSRSLDDPCDQQRYDRDDRPAGQDPGCAAAVRARRAVWRSGADAGAHALPAMAHLAAGDFLRPAARLGIAGQPHGQDAVDTAERDTEKALKRDRAARPQNRRSGWAALRVSQEGSASLVHG